MEGRVGGGDGGGEMRWRGARVEGTEGRVGGRRDGGDGGGGGWWGRRDGGGGGKGGW